MFWGKWSIVDKQMCIFEAIKDNNRTPYDGKKENSMVCMLYEDLASDNLKAERLL